MDLDNDGKVDFSEYLALMEVLDRPGALAARKVCKSDRFVEFCCAKFSCPLAANGLLYVKQRNCMPLNPCGVRAKIWHYVEDACDLFYCAFYAS